MPTRATSQRLGAQVHAGASSLRVLLHVAGIHCPSCVEHITRLLRSLRVADDDCLDDVSVSFLDHTILFHLPLHGDGTDHHTRQSLQKVVAALTQEGYTPNAIECKAVNASQDGQASAFSLHGIGQDDGVEEGEQYGVGKEGPSEAQGRLRWLWRQIFHPQQHARQREREQRWERHLQVCRSCREGLGDTASVDGQQQSESSREHEWVADLAVSGMTCASCVSNVQRVVEAVEGVKSIKVSLMGASARLVVSVEEAINAATEAINDSGYDAEVVAKHPSKGVKGTQSLWKVTFSLRGLTCASCVSNVERAAKESGPELQSFSVSLMQGSAMATLRALDVGEAQATAGQVCEAIEDCGYECSLQEVSKQDEESGSRPIERTVLLRIDGMFCSHCIDKVRRYLQDNSSISVEGPALAVLTLSNPTITITYTPSPTTTLRSILADVDHLDPAFRAQLVTPPSISSRSALHAQEELRSLSIRLALAFVFVPPTLLIAVIVPAFLSPSHRLRVALSAQILGQASLGDVLLFALATPVQFGVGSIFHRRAFKSLRSVWRKGRSWTDRAVRWGDMNVLVMLGTSVAYFASLAFLIVDASRTATREAMDGSMSYFDACVFLIFFILLGRVLEAWSKRKTSSAVSALGSLRPSTGLLLSSPEAPASSAVTTLPVELLELGDLVLVPSGSSPPLDATFVFTAAHPTCTFLEAAISGESKPVVKDDGDQLYAGTVNQSPSAVVARVNALAGHSLIDSVIEIVQSSSTRKADIEQLADRVTSHFVPIIVLLALVVLLAWLAALYSPGGLSDEWKHRHVQNVDQAGSLFLYALQFSVSVLVVACPCGIGLAAPTAQIIAIGLASKHGILVQGGGQAFQAAVQLAKKTTKKAFVFDKTGTITHGTDGSVEDVHLQSLPDGWSEQSLWRAVWLVEGTSGHPLAVGIRRWCEGQAIDSASDIHIEGVEEVAGRGLCARVSTPPATLLVGSMAFMEEQTPDMAITEEVRSVAAKWQAEGASVVFVALQTTKVSTVVAVLSVTDMVRSEAKATIELLKQRYRGQVWMVSGDTLHTARAIASRVGIAEANVVAGVLPAEKAEWVERIKRFRMDGGDLEGQDDSQGSKGSRRMVAFVGDGINDAPALSTADLAIALGSGSSLATSTASFILLNAECPLASIPIILSLSKATHGKIWQNLGWACAFNIVSIPTAAGIFVQQGFIVGPSWSGLAMALSSVTVVLNALTLRLWSPPQAAT